MLHPPMAYILKPEMYFRGGENGDVGRWKLNSNNLIEIF